MMIIKCIVLYYTPEKHHLQSNYGNEVKYFALERAEKVSTATDQEFWETPRGLCGP